MDPLSITTGIITILGVVSSAVRARRAVYKAPGEVESLLNDLTDSEIIIKDVEATLQEAGIANAQSSDLTNSLEATIALLDELLRIIRDDIRKTGNSLKVNRLAWIRAKHKVTTLRTSLDRIRLELNRRPGRFETSVMFSMLGRQPHFERCL